MIRPNTSGNPDGHGMPDPLMTDQLRIQLVKNATTRKPQKSPASTRPARSGRAESCNSLERVATVRKQTLATAAAAGAFSRV